MTPISAAPPTAAVKPIINRHISEILDAPTHDRAAAMAETPRLLKWLSKQIATGQAHPDVQQMSEEVEYLIDLLDYG